MKKGLRPLVKEIRVDRLVRTDDLMKKGLRRGTIGSCSMRRVRTDDLMKKGLRPSQSVVRYHSVVVFEPMT